MATESVLSDKASPPKEPAIRAALGGRFALWQDLVAVPTPLCGPIENKWSFYTKKSGWLLLLRHKDLTLCTLIPRAEDLVVIFLFPERAVERAREAGLPAEIMEAIEGAKAYKSGRPFRVLVRGAADLEPVSVLVEIKLESAGKRKRPPN